MLTANWDPSIHDSSYVIYIKSTLVNTTALNLIF